MPSVYVAIKMFIKCDPLLVQLLNYFSYRSAQEKSSFFFAFRRGTPLVRFFFFFFLRRKIKNTYFSEGCLREISRRHSAKVRGETPRRFAEKLREISLWVGKDLRYLHADSEDSDRMKKIERMPGLILVFTRRVIKQTRYVPNKITGCAATGEEQCTCNCNCIF